MNELFILLVGIALVYWSFKDHGSEKTAIWSGPPGGPFRKSNCRFAMEVATALGTPAVVLDRIAETLRMIEHGRRWHVNGAFPDPDGGPDAYLLMASARLDNGGISDVTVKVFARDQSSEWLIVLVIYAYSLTEDVAKQEMDRQEGDWVVAMVLLTIGDRLRASSGTPRPSNENPIAPWRWDEPCCGWHTNQKFPYWGWKIRLQRNLLG